MKSMIIDIHKTTFQTEHSETSEVIIFNFQALSILRADLIEALGLKKAKKLLFNYGQQLGTTDAQLMRTKYLSIKEQINEGPIRHSRQGHIKGAIFEGSVEYHSDKTMKSIQGKGTWIHSFEAQEHLNKFGESTDAVCYILAGYANGYMSTVCEFHVEVVEKTCVGKGDMYCTWEIHTVNSQIGDRLDSATEEVKFDLNELDAIQNTMIQAITDGATVEKILKQAEKTFNRSFIVEDIFYNFAHSAGLQDYEKLQIQQDMLAYDQKERYQLGEQFFERRQQLAFLKKEMQLKNHSRLTDTIVIRNKVVAYLSIVSKQSKSFSANDRLILLKMTNIISLLLMTNQIKINSNDAEENQFLQSLLLKRYASSEEILSKSRFFNIDINQPYTVAILRWKTNSMQIQKEIKQFIRRQFQKHRLLFTTQNQELVLLLFHRSNNEQKNDSEFHRLSNELEAQFPKHSFQLGYSVIGHSLLEVNKHYHEASLSLVSQPNAQVSAFKDIRVLSIFINDSNYEHIQQIAKHKFARILSLRQPRRRELLQTLYTYLNNSLKIETTMQILSISKSGLLYRLEKIKEYLGSDLKEPNEIFQLLLLLKAIETFHYTNELTVEEFDMDF